MGEGSPSVSVATNLYRGRRAASIENEHLRVTVLEGGGHIAEILMRQASNETGLSLEVVAR